MLSACYKVNLILSKNDTSKRICCLDHSKKNKTKQNKQPKKTQKPTQPNNNKNPRKPNQINKEKHKPLNLKAGKILQYVPFLSQCILPELVYELRLNRRSQYAKI